MKSNPLVLANSTSPPVYQAPRRGSPALNRERFESRLVGGSRKAGRPRLCVGNGDARGASDLTDRDALGCHFAIERGMANAVAVLEFLDREKLGHLGFHIDTQPERNAAEFLAMARDLSRTPRDCLRSNCH